MRNENKPSEHSKCEKCGELIEAQKYNDHANLHTEKKYLAPTTNSNNITKKLSVPILLEDSTDMSDLQSILPDDIPKPQGENRKRHIPGSGSDGTGSGLGGGAYVGRSAFDEDSLYYDPDVNDLTSYIDTGNQIGREPVEQLNIQKSVEINPIRKKINNREVKFYQNSHQAKSNRDNGLSEKKVNNANQGQSSQSIVGAYQLEPAVKEGSSTVVIPLGRKNGGAPVFRAVDTTSNPEAMRKANRGAAYREEEDESQRGGKSGGFVKRRQGHHPGHTHNLQCEECHGFYCEHCKSFIPPQYRKYWQLHQEDEQVTKWYKQMAEHLKKSKDCKHCNQQRQQQQRRSRQQQRRSRESQHH